MIVHRRYARRLAYANGAIWALGNGLASTTLVIYLAFELEAPALGLGIGLLVAAPQLAGTARIGAGAVIGRLADRKRFCLACYLLSGIVLMALPLVAAPGVLPSPTASLSALVGCWCVYHLLEYLGTIGLWSWLADLVPRRVRGRFLGRRQRWMLVGQIVAMVAAGLFVWYWKNHYPSRPAWLAYALLAEVGAALMLAAVLPLASMPGLSPRSRAKTTTPLRAMLAPLADTRFLRLVLFGCWVSFVNGLTQSAQYHYPIEVLGLGLVTMLLLRTGMRCGQVVVSPWMGRLADRWGNRPVIAGSLLLVATGPLFFLAATPRQWWWFVGAWVVWIAYAGINVALPNLLLRLSPRAENAPHIATYFAATGLCYAAGTILGGAALDHLGGQTFAILGYATRLDFYQYSFLLGWLARSLGVVLLFSAVVERDR